jgi:hypothetical protein
MSRPVLRRHALAALTWPVTLGLRSVARAQTVVNVIAFGGGVN